MVVRRPSGRYAFMTAKNTAELISTLDTVDGDYERYLGMVTNEIMRRRQVRPLVVLLFSETAVNTTLMEIWKQLSRDRKIYVFRVGTAKPTNELSADDGESFEDILACSAISMTLGDVRRNPAIDSENVTTTPRPRIVPFSRTTRRPTTTRPVTSLSPKARPVFRKKDEELEKLSAHEFNTATVRPLEATTARFRLLPVRQANDVDSDIAPPAFASAESSTQPFRPQSRAPTPTTPFAPPTVRTQAASVLQSPPTNAPLPHHAFHATPHPRATTHHTQTSHEVSIHSTTPTHQSLAAATPPPHLVFTQSVTPPHQSFAPPTPPTHRVFAPTTTTPYQGFTHTTAPPPRGGFIHFSAPDRHVIPVTAASDHAIRPVRSQRTTTARATTRHTTTSTAPTTTTERTPPGCIADIIFLMDFSDGTGDKSKRYLDIAAAAVGRLPISQNAVRVSLVRYSGPGRAETLFHLDKHTNKDNLIEELFRMEPTGGTTRTGEAIIHAVKEFNNRKHGARKWARKFIVVFTDGYSQEDPAPAAEAARSEGILLLAVAVEDSQLRPNQDELLEITRNRDLVLISPNGQQLREKILGNQCYL